MVISQIVNGKRGRVTVHTDSGLSFPLYKSELGPHNIEVDREFTQEDYLRLRSDVLDARAKNRALYLLNSMDRTSHQLREKLKVDGYPEDVIDEAVGYMESFHYLDDHRYSCSYVRYRSSDKSRMRIKLELLRKGVTEDIIESALSEEYLSDEEEIISGLLQKSGYDPQNADRAIKSKLYRSFVRRGFELSAIRHAMEL